MITDEMFQEIIDKQIEKETKRKERRNKWLVEETFICAESYFQLYYVEGHTIMELPEFINIYNEEGRFFRTRKPENLCVQIDDVKRCLELIKQSKLAKK